MLEYQNLDQASIGLSKLLLTEGVRRKTRGFDCIEIPYPVMFRITNPLDRAVNIPERKSSKTLPFAETLALVSGVNSMELYSGYVPNMIQYSDDGIHQRAGYGPRIRSFIGTSGEYSGQKPFEVYKTSSVEPVGLKRNDQLAYVVKILTKDPNSRQAVISITDPANDQLDSHGNLVDTKDIPCCRLLQFMIVDGKLDMTVYFRSNDVLFGLQQVNVFNNTFIQEMISYILGVPVGNYYHIANNLHFYDDKLDLITMLASKNGFDYETKFPDWKGYGEHFTLKEFDLRIRDLSLYRLQLVHKEVDTLYNLKSDLFYDWAKVFYRFHTKDLTVNFKNPYINKLFNRPVLAPGAEYVKVLQNNGSWEFYEVFKPKAYMKRCEQDGKTAVYVGRVDKFGYLNN